MDDIDPEQYDIAKAASADAYALYANPMHLGGAVTPTDALVEIYIAVHGATLRMLLEQYGHPRCVRCGVRLHGSGRMEHRQTCR